MLICDENINVVKLSCRQIMSQHIMAYIDYYSLASALFFNERTDINQLIHNDKLNRTYVEEELNLYM